MNACWAGAWAAAGHDRDRARRNAHGDERALEPRTYRHSLPGDRSAHRRLGRPAQGARPDEVGEIAIRGPNVFKGYWNKPQATQEAFVDGYFLTGDIGKLDDKGQFSIVDRKKNMIISSGFNVYPVAIENAIYEHDDVKEVIVIGVPDAYRGQAAKAFVTLKQGARMLTLETLREFLSDRIGRHEMPTALEIRAELPRSPAGKLLAKVLIDEENAKGVPRERPAKQRNRQSCRGPRRIPAAPSRPEVRV